MKRKAMALVASVMLFGSAGVFSAAEGGVSLERKGFDIEQNYTLCEDAEIVELSDMGLEMYDITPDLSEFYNSKFETIEHIGADDGYVFFEIRNKSADTTEVVRTNCVTGETSLYRCVDSFEAILNYIDNEYILYTVPNGYAGAGSYSCVYSDEGFVIRLKYPVRSNSSCTRVGSTIYYDGMVYGDFIDGEFVFSQDGYSVKYSMPVIFQYNTKTAGDNSIFKFNAKAPHYGAGELSYIHYMSPDNLYNSKSNYIDYQDYSDGAYVGYTYRIKDGHPFGDRYALGYCYFSGTEKMKELAVSKNGAKPSDLHITKNAFAAWNTTTKLSDKACPIIMDIYSKKLVALDGMPSTCTIECDNSWLYFIKDYIAINADKPDETIFRIVSIR